MGKRDPKGIDEIIKSMRQSPEMGKHFRVARIWEAWPDLVGAHLMPHGRPLGLRDGTLVIEVVNSVWMHKFSYRKWRIMKKVNALVGEKMVSDLYFVLSDEASEDEGPDSTR
jgi:predicted nucleic acid-binding Zn ribbon protein